MKRALVVLALAGCGRAAAGQLDVQAATRLFAQLPLDTEAHGLSDLAIDDGGAIWTEGERDRVVLRITVDGARVKSVRDYHIEGVADDVDLEAIAWLGRGRLAFGTEGAAGAATIRIADIDDDKGEIDVHPDAIDLTKAPLGVAIERNKGVEGLCGKGDVALAAIESNDRDARGRWAPLVRVDLAHGTLEPLRIALTSDVGKISALACTFAADGTVQVLAIERHFGVARLLRATVPPPGKAPVPPDRITPTVALDLSTVVNDALNLEGIGVLKDGRVVAINDNDYGGPQGPTELVVFKPGVVP